jgi:hypothetical protein
MRAVVALVVLVALFGCKSRDSSGPSNAAGGDGGHGGTAGSPPQQTEQDSSIDEPPHDAGAEADAVTPELPPNFVLECDGEQPSDAAEDVLAVWQAERDAHDEMGYAASFEAHGATYRVNGIAGSPIQGPFAFHISSAGVGLISFADAEIDIDGETETGRAELYAANDEGDVMASAGSIDGLQLNTISVESGQLDGTMELASESIGNTPLFHAAATVTDLTIENAHQVYLYPTDSTGGIDDRIEWMPTGPVVFQTASSLTFYDSEITLKKDLSNPAVLEYEAFSMAGDFSTGSIESDELEVRGTPVAIFGSGAELELGASSLQSHGSFQMTQAVNEVGLVIPAAVEVVSAEREIWVRPSESRIVQLHYRERSYRGDAVLGEVQIGGAAADLLELKTGFRLALTEQIIGAVIDTGWAAPLAAIAVLPTVSIVFVVDIFSCFFGGCSTGPDLEPFPQWMQAGEIGTMELLVKGNLSPGSYDASVTFVGRNYCPVTVPLTINIGERPADGGTDAMIDDGAVDAN